MIGVIEYVVVDDDELKSRSDISILTFIHLSYTFYHPTPQANARCRVSTVVLAYESS